MGIFVCLRLACHSRKVSGWVSGRAWSCSSEACPLWALSSLFIFPELQIFYVMGVKISVFLESLE